MAEKKVFSFYKLSESEKKSLCNAVHKEKQTELPGMSRGIEANQKTFEDRNRTVRLNPENDLRKSTQQSEVKTNVNYVQNEEVKKKSKSPIIVVALVIALVGFSACKMIDNNSENADFENSTTINLSTEKPTEHTTLMYGKRSTKEVIDYMKSENMYNKTILAGYKHTLGLKSDRTVVAVGSNKYGQCDVTAWKDIVQVSAKDYHTVGLKSDGTVVAVGNNCIGQCDVTAWKDIVQVSAGSYHTIGLKSDGTVVAVGANEYDGECNVKDWKDIVQISAGSSHTVGLKSDGTVVAVGKNDYGQCDVQDWKDIVQVSAGACYTVGLKKDGTVVAVGDNEKGQCDVTAWKDIVQVSAGSYHTVGLKKDETVVAVGNNEYGQCDVTVWKDIVQVSAGSYHTVGLKSDGTVVAVGSDEYDGKCNVGTWKDMMVYKKSLG